MTTMGTNGGASTEMQKHGRVQACRRATQTASHGAPLLRLRFSITTLLIEGREHVTGGTWWLCPDWSGGGAVKGKTGATIGGATHRCSFPELYQAERSSRLQLNGEREGQRLGEGKPVAAQ